MPKFQMTKPAKVKGEEGFKSVKETFIPFVHERDEIGRMFDQTLVENRLGNSIFIAESSTLYPTNLKGVNQGNDINL